VNQKCLPLLRWAGSKKRQYGSISNFFPQSFERYAEPFAGSAAFAFCMGAQKAILNDINEDLISFYLNVVVDPENFYNEFINIPRDESNYYRIRQEFNQIESGEHKSILFYYLNRNCFNGIHRLNKRGEFNVPFSSSRVSSYLARDEFMRSVEVVSAAKIYCVDFEVFCDKNLDVGDFVFIDPPYYAAERIFNEYNVKPFNQDDFCRLGKLISKLDKRGIRFLLSFPEVEDSIKLASQWENASVPVRRTIAGDPSKRRIANELLIYNYAL
jgi:DNA adenine methylase